MAGVLYGRQGRSRACMATVIAAFAVVTLAPVRAQSLFGFRPAAESESAKQPAPDAAPAAQQQAVSSRRRMHRREHARRFRSLQAESSRESAARERPTRDRERAGRERESAARDLAKQGEQSGLGERINGNTISLISGRLDSTDASVASDLAAVLDEGDNLRIIPVIGRGGGQNIRDVRFMKGIDLGIAPVNLLNEFKRSNRIGPLDDTIVYVAKLFNEEMHVVVRADSPVTTVAQLSGQRVDFGEPGSGTEIATRDVFARLGIRAQEVDLDQAEALQKLKSGEIAAAVLLAGKPTAAIAKLNSDGFRLLPLPYPKELQRDYLPASLASQDYPTLIAPGAQIDTIAVGTVLIAYNWPRGSEPYRRIEKFVDAFFPRLAQFQSPPRHPKWQEVSLTAVLPGWTRFAAAEEWLQRGRQQVEGGGRRIEDAMAAREATSGKGEGAPAQEVDRLFHQFLKWNQARERH